VKTVDPVCGMQVDTESATLRSEYRGETYYFCKSACRKAFDANPENYVTRGASAVGHGSREHPMQR
jgi:YHS domain-containing protein